MDDSYYYSNWKLLRQVIKITEPLQAETAQKDERRMRKNIPTRLARLAVDGVIASPSGELYWSSPRALWTAFWYCDHCRHSLTMTMMMTAPTTAAAVPPITPPINMSERRDPSLIGSVFNTSTNSNVSSWHRLVLAKGGRPQPTRRTTLCPNKKHVTTFYTITLTISVRLQ